MALAQVERVKARLTEAHPDVTVEVVSMTTSGDRWQGSLAALGGKGAFTKEVDAALLDGRVDLAVHCVKDVPGDRPAPAGTVMAAFMARDDVRDCLVHPGGLTIDQLPAGTTADPVTGSPGRDSVLASLRSFVRGSVATLASFQMPAPAGSEPAHAAALSQQPAPMLYPSISTAWRR